MPRENWPPAQSKLHTLAPHVAPAPCKPRSKPRSTPRSKPTRQPTDRPTDKDARILCLRFVLAKKKLLSENIFFFVWATKCRPNDRERAWAKKVNEKTDIRIGAPRAGEHLVIKRPFFYSGAHFSWRHAFLKVAPQQKLLFVRRASVAYGGRENNCLPLALHFARGPPRPPGQQTKWKASGM